MCAFIYSFYRATLCVSAVLLSLGVRLSVTLVHCIHMAGDIVRLLYRPGSPIILVFWHPAPVPKSKENPFSGGAKYTMGGKILWFSTEIAVYLRNGMK